MRRGVLEVRIERVEIENVLSHRLTRIEFPAGVVAIVGPNGAGKTSIVDSISYALFGTHSRDPQGRKRQALLRLGAARARIELVFDANGRRYQVVREFSRTGSTSAMLTLVEEGGKRRLLARSVKSVEAELAKIFGMPLDLAQRLYITRQGELDSILVDKSKRLDLLNSLLQLKEMETVYEMLGNIYRQLQREKAIYEKRYEEMLREVERLKKSRQELNSLRRAVAELEPKVKGIEEEIGRLEEAAQKLHALRQELAGTRQQLGAVEEKERILEDSLHERRDRLRRAEEAASTLEKLRPELKVLEKLEEARELAQRLAETREALEELEAKRKRIEEQLGRMKDLEARARELEELRQKLERLEPEARRYIELKKSVDDTQRELDEVNAEAAELRKAIEAEVRSVLGLEPGDPLAVGERLAAIKDKLDELLEKARQRRERVSNEIAKLRQKREELSNYLDMLTSAEGVCPLCRRPLDERHRVQLIQQLRSEKKRIEADLQRLSRELALVESEIHELEKKKRAVERLLDRIRGRYERLRLLVERSEALARNLEELRQDFLAAFTSYKEYEEAKARIRELEGAERELAELRALKLHLESIADEEARKRTEAERIATRLNTILKEAGVNIEELEEKLRDLQRLRLEAARLEQLASELDALRASVEELESELAGLRAERLRLQERLRGLEEELARYEGVEEELREKRRQYQELRDQIARMKGRIEQLEREVTRLEVVQEEANRLKNKLEAYMSALAAVERLRRVFGPQGLPRLVRVKARNVIEYHLRDMLARFNLDFVDVRLGDDYEAVIVSRDGEKTVNMLSGGERVALAIAYRLALARAVGGRLGSLVMDEPTIHLDEERKRELIDIIRYGLEATGLQQLIIVTHDRELEEAADIVLEVRKENGVSRVEPREPLAAAEGLKAAPTG